MQFAGVDPSSPPVIDILRQCMELLDLEKPAPDALFAPEPGDLLLGRFSCVGAVRVGKMRNGSR